jgi:uncharacterized protein (TIGR00251 family)
MGGLSIRETREGAAFQVKVQPGAPATRVKGEHAGALKVAVAAPPEKGKANEALVRFLAEALGVGRGDVAITAGETSRLKSVVVRGIAAAALAARLDGLVKAKG